MVVIDLANEMKRLSSSSDMDGSNSTMSNFIKRDLPFVVTVVVFCHWLTLMGLAIFAIMFSRCFLLTSFNSLFAGLISLHLALFRQFG